MSSPATSGVDLSSILSNLIWFAFLGMMIFGQKLQFYMSLLQVRGGLARARGFSEFSRKKLMTYLGGLPSSLSDISERINEFHEYVVITPESMDPAGIVPKMRHVVGVRDERVRTEIKAIFPNASSLQIAIAENELEISSALHMVFKVLRHYYEQAKRTNSIYMMIQLQMIMPLVMEQIEALSGAMEGIEKNHPLGDTAGPVTVSKYMLSTSEEIARDTVLSVNDYKGRTLYVIKAKGPEAYVGDPGKAIEAVFARLEEKKAKVSAFITVDAALKLEGEKSGTISEGVGVAIGGLGIERFEMESAASRHNVPVYAILVKQSIKEAISSMTKEIAEGSLVARQKLERLLEEKTKEGDVVILVGVGNTSGCGQSPLDPALAYQQQK